MEGGKCRKSNNRTEREENHRLGKEGGGKRKEKKISNRNKNKKCKVSRIEDSQGTHNQGVTLERKGR